MKAKIVVDGVEYPVPATFTYRESSLIKRLSGVRMGEMLGALQAGDTDLIIALTVVAAGRAGVQIDPDQLLDGDLDSIQFVAEEDDAGPPAASGTPTSGPATPVTPPASANGTDESSSSSASRSPETTPAPDGSRT